MRISKTLFIESLRCDRFASLHDLEKEQENSFVLIDGVEYDSELYQEKVSEFLEELDLIELDFDSLEVMMPYFNEIEILAGKYMKKKFGYSVVNSLDTSKQKKLEIAYSDAILFAYLDVYQETEFGYNICEVKAKSSNAIWKIGKAYNREDQENNQPKDYKSIFKKCEDGICRLREDLDDFSFESSVLSEKEYMKHRAKLFDYNHDFGRVVLDLSFQRFIAERVFNVNQSSYYVGLVNCEYVYDGSMEDGKIIYNQDLKGEEIITLVDLTKVTLEMQEKLEVLLKKVIERFEKGDVNPVPLGKYCMRKKTRQCKYFDICWKNIPTKNSIFTYFNNHHGFKSEDGHKYDTFDLLNSGITRMQDIDLGILNRPKNVIQRNCVDTNTAYVDQSKIRSAIKTLNYPIYHLDFESLPLPLPRYKGEKCYSQSVFQFSIHVEKSPGVCDKDLDHFEFLAVNHNDNRRALVEKMIDTIKDDGGSVVVYNESFEKGRIREFAEFFPEYKSKLYDIHDRIFDLLYVLNGSKKFYESFGYDMSEVPMVYYHPNQNGSYSIKNILPLFSDLSYSEMEVSNGNVAMLTYGKYPKYSKEVFEQKYQALIEYCKQDTWAMVVILDELRKI
ncbi:MAG: DUF2779 domain-containing protein [Bacilli bacterium]